MTNPVGATDNATRSLLDILSEITSISLVTASIGDDSEIPDEHEVVEISEAGTGDSILVSAFRFLVNQMRMCAALRKRDEDTVLFFGSTSYLIPILFARLIGKTVVLQPRGDVPLSLRHQWEARVPSFAARFLAGVVAMMENIGYRSADGIITYSPSMADDLDLSRFEDKLYPNGARYVQTDLFDVEVPYDDRDDAVGFLGRLDEEKGVRELAKVARRIDSYRFIFVGDGALREWLRDELADEIESGRVELKGWVDHDEVPDELNRFKLLVNLSHTEGLPTTVIESFACGTPVYASPVSGVRDLVFEEETGFLMEERDPDLITEDLHEALGRDDLDEMSRNCRELAVDEYSFEAAVRRYTKILDSIQ